MDLLDLVLARLPVDAFLKTGRDPIIRRKVVNKLSLIKRQKFYSRRKWLGWDISQAYILECALQSELSISAKQFIPTTLLCSRAAFLRDARWYEYFVTTSDTYLDLNLDFALISEVPEIQALALTYNFGGVLVDSPELINWTPGLIRYLSAKNTNVPDRLRGYLHIATSSRVDRDYISGFIQSEMEQQIDPFQPNPKIDEIESEDLLKISVKNGYFARTIGYDNELLVKLSMKYVQPKLLARLQKIRTTEFIIAKSITRSMIKRVREMLSLIEQLYPEAVLYRSQLRVICGMSVDVSDPHFEWKIIGVMEAVAHPQIREVELYHPTYLSHGVYYDLNRYVFPKGLPHSDRDIGKIHVLYAIGATIDSTISKDVLFSVQSSRSSIINRDRHIELRERFHRIVKILKSE